MADQNYTPEQKVERMRDAIEIERSRLYAIGNRPAARALAELLDYPDSMAQLHDIILGVYP